MATQSNVETLNEEMVRTWLEQQVRSHGITYRDAVAKFRMGTTEATMLAALDNVVAEHDRGVKTPQNFTDVTVAQRRDLLEAGWYPGSSPETPVWSRLRRNMMESALSASFEKIDRSTEQIVRQLAEPNAKGDKRLGAVVGNVQSGKTANYAAVIAKAVDAGYRLVIVLSGIHNNLRSQTQLRLDRDLLVGSTEVRWHRLTDPAADFGTAERKNATTIIAGPEQRVLAVVKKNSGRLRNLISFLNAIDPQTMNHTPVLIIDDESDQATPDSSRKDSESPTVINGLLKEVWGKVRNGSYVGYTATPFANFFMDPDDTNGLYPRDFVHVMPTPEQYFGAERIFGMSAEDSDESFGATEGADVVRPIPGSELDLLRPKKRDESRDFQPKVTKSLGQAIRWFIVASAIRRVRGQKDEHSSMLLHTTQYTDPHFGMKEAVNDFLVELKDAAFDEDVKSFREVFKEERDRAAELYHGEDGAVPWSSVEKQIFEVLRVLNVVVDNGIEEEERRLSYENSPQTVIVIGGGTLARGLTLEGLFVSYFTRSSNTYDTLLQMGRWFGYRVGYEDLQRIWISEGLDEDYRFLARVESEMRSEIQTMIDEGKRPEEIGIRIRQHPGRLQITAVNKMKHTDEVEVDFEGYRMQTYIFDVLDGEAMASNLSRTKHFLKGICGHYDEGHRVYSDIPFEKIREFMDGFKVNEKFKKLHSKSLEWTAEKLPEVPWNVVVASGSIDATTLKDTPSPVNPVKRAPIALRDGSEDTGSVNIRTLMTGDDMVIDFKRLKTLPQDVSRDGLGGSLSMKEMKSARKAAGGAAGKGLLVLYPISRHSSVSESQRGTARSSMETVLESMGIEIEPGEAEPIIGYGMVIPSDTEGKLKHRGTYIAVRPDVTDAVDEDEFLPETVQDSEGNFSG